MENPVFFVFQFKKAQTEHGIADLKDHIRSQKLVLAGNSSPWHTLYSTGVYLLTVFQQLMSCKKWFAIWTFFRYPTHKEKKPVVGLFFSLFLCSVYQHWSSYGNRVNGTSGRRVRRESRGWGTVSLEVLPLADLWSLLIGVHRLGERFTQPHLQAFMLN